MKNLRFEGTLPRLSVLLLSAAILAACVVESPRREEALSVVSNAAWLAYRDGFQRPWRVIVADNENTDQKIYTLQAVDLDKRFAVAMVCPDKGAGVHRVFLLYAAATEVSRLREGCQVPLDRLARHQVSGTLTGTQRRVRLSFVPGEEAEFYGGYALRVPERTTDVLAVTGPSGPEGIDPEKILVLRGFEVIGNDGEGEQQIPLDLDFSAGLAHETAPAVEVSVSPGEAATGELEWRARVELGTGRNRLVLQRLRPEDGASRMAFRGLPSEALQEGEGHRAVLQWLDDVGEVVRAGVRAFATPAPVALGVPAPFDPQARVERLALSWAAPAEDALFGPLRLASWYLEGQGRAEDGTPVSVRWEIHVDVSWMEPDEASGRIVLPLPDFSGLPGWQASWLPSSGFDRWRLEVYFSDDDTGRLVSGILEGKVVPGLAYGLVSRRGP